MFGVHNIKILVYLDWDLEYEIHLDRIWSSYTVYRTFQWTTGIMRILKVLITSVIFVSSIQKLIKIKTLGKCQTEQEFLVDFNRIASKIFLK